MRTALCLAIGVAIVAATVGSVLSMVQVRVSALVSLVGPLTVTATVCFPAERPLGASANVRLFASSEIGMPLRDQTVRVNC